MDLGTVGVGVGFGVPIGCQSPTCQPLPQCLDSATSQDFSSGVREWRQWIRSLPQHPLPENRPSAGRPASMPSLLLLSAQGWSVDSLLLSYVPLVSLSSSILSLPLCTLSLSSRIAPPVSPFPVYVPLPLHGPPLSVSHEGSVAPHLSYFSFRSNALLSPFRHSC